MTAQQPSTRRSLSRRGALGLIGAASLAVGGAVAVVNSSRADAGRGGPPSELLPGGAFDQYVSGLAADDQFSGTVLLGWHGTPTLVRAYHEADKAKNTPNRADTIFFLASTTKFLTGVAVTQLAAQGKVDFHAPLSTYLDGFSSGLGAVTVHQLLTHTSGLPGSLDGMRKQWPTRVATFNGMLDLLRPQQPVTDPGTTYAYSNANYFLATAIVAAASGQYYWDYMPRHVFGPAGMRSSGLYSDQRWADDPRIAHVYGPSVDGQRQDVTAQAASGPNVDEIFSTAPDLLRLTNALAHGTLLPPAWERLRVGGRYPVDPARNDPDAPATSTSFQIGYGSDERITPGGQRAYGHTGGLQIPVSGSSDTGGANTALTVYPDLGVVAVVLANYSLKAIGGIGAFLTEQDRIITGG
jgi:CubicO group peptidase (beta-lactamase class C family)